MARRYADFEHYVKQELTLDPRYQQKGMAQLRMGVAKVMEQSHSASAFCNVVEQAQESARAKREEAQQSARAKKGHRLPLPPSQQPASSQQSARTAEPREASEAQLSQRGEKQRMSYAFSEPAQSSARSARSRKSHLSHDDLFEASNSERDGPPSHRRLREGPPSQRGLVRGDSSGHFDEEDVERRLA